MCDRMGYKLPTGSERFTAVPDEQVEILFGPPSRPFKQIGIVSVLGAPRIRLT
jgi:hypothetical protein